MVAGDGSWIGQWPSAWQSLRQPDPHTVSANGSWIGMRQSACQSLNFNSLDVNAAITQRESRPAFASPRIVSANAGLNHCHPSDLPVDGGLFTVDGGKAAPNQQKKFLIFDQSGEETRMLFSSICNPAAVSSKPFPTYELPGELRTFKKEGSCPRVPGLLDSGENLNHVTDESSDYREDTEEINALLYSDNDGDDFCDTEDEDEMSTGHSPISMEGEEFDEEVTSLGHPTKRQKLLEGDSCRKLPLSFNDESVVDLNSSNGEQASPTVGCKRARKDKIHDTLRILQKLIPGSKSSNDPLIIIDGAIEYLKSLKAEPPQIEEAEGSSWLGPCL